MRGCVIELLCDWVNCCLAGFGRGCKHLPKKDLGIGITDSQKLWRPSSSAWWNGKLKSQGVYKANHTILEPYGGWCISQTTL